MRTECSPSFLHVAPTSQMTGPVVQKCSGAMYRMCIYEDETSGPSFPPDSPHFFYDFSPFLTSGSCPEILAFFLFQRIPFERERERAN